MLKQAFYVESDTISPIAASKGDTVVVVRLPESPALVSTWRRARGIVRERIVAEGLISSLLLAAMNDDVLSLTLTVYEPSALAPQRFA